METNRIEYRRHEIVNVQVNGKQLFQIQIGGGTFTYQTIEQATAAIDEHLTSWSAPHYRTGGNNDEV